MSFYGTITDVKESAARAENQKITMDLTANYTGGSIDYSVISGSGDTKPVLIVPGFTEGRVVLQSLAETFNELGNRSVIFPDQPNLDSSKAKLSIVDHHAEALLAIVKAQGLEQAPLDVISHSFGSVVAARAAELAKQRDQDITSFDASKGSHMVFIAPANTNDKESLAFLAGRWAKFMAQGLLYGKELDPTGEKMRAGVRNFTKDPAKTAKEIAFLRKKSAIYSNLGGIGIKPIIVGYPSDYVFPDKVVKDVIQANGANIDSYFMPIDTNDVGAGNFKDFKNRSGLSGKAARNAWAHHYRNAGHNDLLFNPERTVKAILQVIE